MADRSYTDEILNGTAAIERAAPEFAKAAGTIRAAVLMARDLDPRAKVIRNARGQYLRAGTLGGTGSLDRAAEHIIMAAELFVELWLDADHDEAEAIQTLHVRVNRHIEDAREHVMHDARRRAAAA